MDAFISLVVAVFLFLLARTQRHAPRPAAPAHLLPARTSSPGQPLSGPSNNLMLSACFFKCFALKRLPTHARPLLHPHTRTHGHTRAGKPNGPETYDAAEHIMKVFFEVLHSSAEGIGRYKGKVILSSRRRCDVCGGCACLCACYHHT